jgi:putative membrane protein
MKDLMERFISKADRERIDDCVRKAESLTRGEIVVMVVPESHRYPTACVMGAIALSFPVAVALTPTLGDLFRAGPSNMWIFLAALIPLFLIFQEAVKRIHSLKRFFISRKEMEEEVREEAQIQFFRKGLYRTREESGVLIYISVFERKVWVLGDRGINAEIPEVKWNGIVVMMVQAIKDGNPAEGICRAVNEVGWILKDKFPVKPGDRNELENMIIGY